MAKTKQALEQELRIYKSMYEKANKERMYYYFLLHDIANDFNNCALDIIKTNLDEDFLINTDIDCTSILIARKIKGE